MVRKSSRNVPEPTHNAARVQTHTNIARRSEAKQGTSTPAYLPKHKVSWVALHRSIDSPLVTLVRVGIAQLVAQLVVGGRRNVLTGQCRSHGAVPETKSISKPTNHSTTQPLSPPPFIQPIKQFRRRSRSLAHTASPLTHLCPAALKAPTSKYTERSSLLT